MKTANQVFLEDLNKAFANNDSEYVLNQVTEDIQWDIIGDRTIIGKENFENTLHEIMLDEPLSLEIHHIITQGIHASVNGVLTTPEGHSFGFCDVVIFNSLKDPKIKSITSYSIDISS